MSLISLLIILLLLVVVCYIVQVLPLEPPAKQIFYLVLGTVVILWLLQAFIGLDYPLWRRP